MTCRKDCQELQFITIRLYACPETNGGTESCFAISRAVRSVPHGYIIIGILSRWQDNEPDPWGIGGLNGEDPISLSIMEKGQRAEDGRLERFGT